VRSRWRIHGVLFLGSCRNSTRCSGALARAARSGLRLDAHAPRARRSSPARFQARRRMKRLALAGMRRPHPRCAAPERIARYRVRVGDRLPIASTSKLEVPGRAKHELVAPVPGEHRALFAAAPGASKRERSLRRPAQTPTALLRHAVGDRASFARPNRDGDPARCGMRFARLLPLRPQRVYRVLRVARTIADLAASTAITASTSRKRYSIDVSTRAS